jgi:hypothetical protein
VTHLLAVNTLELDTQQSQEMRTKPPLVHHDSGSSTDMTRRESGRGGRRGEITIVESKKWTLFAYEARSRPNWSLHKHKYKGSGSGG